LAKGRGPRKKSIKDQTPGVGFLEAKTKEVEVNETPERTVWGGTLIKAKFSSVHGSTYLGRIQKGSYR